MRAAIVWVVSPLLFSCADAHAPEEPAAPSPSPSPTVELPDALRRALDRKHEDLQPERRPDGLSRVDWNGRAQSVSLVVKDAEGRLTRFCVERPSAAAHLLGGQP